VVADAGDERRAVAGGKQLVGAFNAEHGDAVGALDVAEGLAHAFEQAAAALGGLRFLGVVVGDEVAKHLGVGLGGEGVALGEQEFFDRDVVFDDAVVNEHDLAVAAEVRVGVGVGDAAVGGPARVRDADVAGEFLLGGVGGEVVHAADLFDQGYPVVLQDRDAGRVVATVFQSLQSLQDDGGRLLFTDIAYDAAHVFLYLGLAKLRAAANARQGNRSYMNTQKNVLAVIMGGGRGTRLYPLTMERCKPAVPLAGKYRLVDIPISNCINSEINRIFLLTQFHTASLHRHIQSTYHFDPFGGGIVDILSAEQTEKNADWYQGTADEVRRNLQHFRSFPHELVLILS